MYQWIDVILLFNVILRGGLGGFAGQGVGLVHNPPSLISRAQSHDQDDHLMITERSLSLDFSLKVVISIRILILYSLRSGV